MRAIALAVAAAVALGAWCPAHAQQERGAPPPPRRERPRERKRPGQARRYSIDQAVSDRAQLHTIAFSALAFLTGNLGSDTFFPPGKVCDFFGFQYLRDIDAGKMGHNTSFLDRAANNVLHVLNDDQKARLVALAKEQQTQLSDYAARRFPLIKAFRRQLVGDVPPESDGLSREAVAAYSARLYLLDGLLSYRRAEVLGAIVRSLSDAQKAELKKMVFGNSATWPKREDRLDRRSLPHGAHVAVMTYASELFSWYAGSVEADVYFCPERHAAYFGAFYMKAAPARGKRDYSISTELTGDSGERFLAMLAPPQRQLVTSLVDVQREALREIVQTRRAIAVELRRFLTEGAADKEKVLALSERYGELDGTIAWHYATHFAAVRKTLTAEQEAALKKLRNLDDYPCRGAFLYSRPIALPRAGDTDFLFREPKGAAAGDPKP